MKYSFWYLVLFLNCSCSKHSTNPTPTPTPIPTPTPTVTTPPTISAAWPNNNPAGWPVMIKGSNLSAVTKVTFNGQPATLDTALDTVVTTTVPSTVAAGNVSLVVENAAGQSNAVTFTVLNQAPNYMSLPPKIVISRPPRYLPSLPNGNEPNIQWSDQYGPNYTITFSNSGFNFETWNNTTNDVNILNFPDSANGWSIQISIQRDTTLVYSGAFIAMDDSTSTTQRILFYDPNNRQIVIVKN